MANANQDIIDELNEITTQDENLEANPVDDTAVTSTEAPLEPDASSSVEPEVMDVEDPITETSESEPVTEVEAEPTDTEEISDEAESAPSDDEGTDEPAVEESTSGENSATEDTTTEEDTASESQELSVTDDPNAKWYVVHTYSGHENRVAQALRQRVESEHLEHKIFDILVPTQDKIEIKSGKKETIKEKIFPGYMLVKMILDDDSWLAVRTTQGVTSFIGMGSKPTAISETEVKTIVKFMQQGGQPTYKTTYNPGDTVRIAEGPFTDFIGKVDNVDKDRGKVRVLVSIFGRETPVELDFLQVTKL
jgi:transcription termination/antitermination protein NusG